jgi:hypothetical protein
MIFTFAVQLPLQEKEGWVTSGFSLLIAVVVPLLLAGASVLESFASECEGPSSSTLLAGRLLDREPSSVKSSLRSLSDGEWQ